MKPVKLSAREKEILTTIAEKGEYKWDQHKHPEMKETLKTMVWRSLIYRKTTYANVFLASGLALKIIEQVQFDEFLRQQDNN